jgi:hypothetical protein
MIRRHTLALFAIALGACSSSHSASDAGPLASEAGAIDAGRIDAGPGPIDAGPGPIDAGPSPIDAGPPTSCTGLNPAECLAEGCVPLFDDECCPTCHPGGCADCTNITWQECLPMTRCEAFEGCGAFPRWACEFSTPNCADAHLSDADSCTVPGCVPAFTPEDPTNRTCVPITASSCRAVCLITPPACPAGTTPEGDGTCFTGRCIPGFVCN